jgi:hypothetical protein
MSHTRVRRRPLLLDADAVQAVEVAARAIGVSAAFVVEQLIEAYLETTHPEPAPASPRPSPAPAVAREPARVISLAHARRRRQQQRAASAQVASRTSPPGRSR